MVKPYRVVSPLVALSCLLVSVSFVSAQSAEDGFTSGANGAVNAIAVQSDGRLVVGGAFTALGQSGTVRNSIGRLNVDGSIDSSYDPGANGAVLAIALQPDGKVVVGGSFTTIGGGGTGATPRSHLARLNTDGSVDTSFNPGASADVNALALQGDGKILVGGSFTTLGGATHTRAARLNADGSLDATFNAGADGVVNVFALQTDGRILIGGAFSSHLSRLNADGSVDSTFAPSPDDIVTRLTVQADGRILVGGRFSRLAGGARRFIGRLTASGALDTSFSASIIASRAPVDGLHAMVLQPDGSIIVGDGDVRRLDVSGRVDSTFVPPVMDPSGWVSTIVAQPDGRLVVGAVFNSGSNPALPGLFRLNPSGSLDAALRPDPDASVFSIAVQTDRRILYGGGFTQMRGSNTPRSFIGRLNEDGTLDTAFNPGASSNVYGLVVMPSGDILVGGDFTTIGGGGNGTVVRNRIARLHADGSVDAGFNPGACCSTVLTMAVQQDGKILVGGLFGNVGGGTGLLSTHQHIARLNSDGSVDESFATQFGGGVDAIVLQPDGKILVAGAFSNVNVGSGPTITRYNIARLNSDGSVDSTFNPGANNEVIGIVLQPDGRIVAGGTFTGLGGGTGATTRNYIGRLNADGSLDTSFDPDASASVRALALQQDGAILVGGYFTKFGTGGSAITRNHIGRLLADGTVDPAFDPGADLYAFAFAQQADGRILVGGDFTQLGGGGSGVSPRNAMGRLTNTAATTASLAVSGSTVTWTRGGPGPEVMTATLESSTDGSTYTALANGARVSGGWQFTGVTIPSAPFVNLRVRGYTSVSMDSGTQSVVASTLNLASTIPALALSGAPASVQTAAGNAASLSVVASGSPAPGYQWQASFNNGQTFSALSDGGPYAGTASDTLSIVTAATLNGAQYRAVVSNTTGTQTSAAATLTVFGPGSVLPSSLRFGATKNGASGALVAVTPSQSLTISFSGAGSPWSATVDQPWIQLTGVTSGSGVGRFTASVTNPNNVIGGSATLTATITISAPSAPNPTLTVPVTLTVDQTGGHGSAPFGSFDTPADGTTGVTGSIAVTGWALDDIGVTGVRILRDAVPPETPGTQVFIGNATFIDGARPDVAGSNPSAPLNARGGWGYLLLTNFLPNRGNGTYKLYAYADDGEGNHTLLGTKTITCTNATATVPFGAIDTPDQGATVGGSSFVNFGWVLAAQGTASGLFIPFDGSSVQVFVDSVSIGTVTSYNHARSDIQSLFPGYANTDGAVGFKIIDTTALANGVHTIVWSASDNKGTTAGIGSRFFAVLNSGTGLSAAPARAGLNAVLSASAITVQHGFDDGAPTDAAMPDDRGVIQVHARVLDRLTLHFAQDGASYRGYELMSGVQKPLPMGSRLDERRGTFSWIPVQGFGGTHQLVFVRTVDGREEVIRVEVRIDVIAGT